jgi:RNA polymerase sigma-70 factor (ECF subfamily)
MIDETEADPRGLILAAQGGDRAAFGRLYGRYARMVHGIALAHLRAQDADDVVQEAFVRALHQLHTLRDVHAFGGWLASIARHLIVDTVRRTRDQVETQDELPSRDNPHHALEAQRALDAIRRLPEAYRDTVMLRLVEGMTGPEIAERTGLTPASVRVNLHRGMKLLRARLEAVGPETHHE